MLSYFDKIHPVVSVITCRPCLRAFQPAHEHTKAVALRRGRRSFITAVRSMKDVHGWSRVSQGFVLGRVHLFVSTTFKANVHEHEHEASWVTSPLKNSTMVLPIIHRAQCSCGISYTALCVFLCVYLCLREGVCMLYLHVWRCKALICKYVSGYICACSITQCVSLYVRECVFPVWSYVLNLVNFFFSLFKMRYIYLTYFFIYLYDFFGMTSLNFIDIKLLVIDLSSALIISIYSTRIAVLLPNMKTS